MTAPSEWVKFFEDANIPTADATKYGVSFAENRISMNMLGDLNKVIIFFCVCIIFPKLKVEGDDTGPPRVLLHPDLY